MQFARQLNNRVRHRLLLLVGAMVLFAAVGMGYEIWRSARIDDAGAAMRDYHLNASVQVEQISKRLLAIRLAAQALPEAAQPQPARDATREIRSQLLTLQQDQARLAELNQTEPHPELDATMARFDGAVERLMNTWEAVQQGGPADAFAGAITTLENTTAQLARLLIVDFEEDLEHIDAQRATHEVTVLGLLTVLLGCAAGTTWVVLRSLNHVILSQTRARTALEAEQARFLSVTQTMSDALVIADETGCIVSCNPATSTLFGHAPEQLIGTDVTVLMPAETAAQHRQALARYLKAGEIRLMGTTREAEGLHADGSRFPLEISLGQVQVDGQRHFTAILRDISARKMAEIELRDSENRMRRTQRMARLGHWEWEVATGKVTWSDETYAIYGHPPGAFEVSFDRAYAAIHPDDVALVDSTLKATFEKGIPFDRQYRVLWEDGSVHHVHGVGELEKDPATGAPLRMTGTLLDITSYKQALEELGKLTKSLNKAQAIAHVGHWEWEIPTGGLYWSDEIYRITGHEPGSVEPSYEKFLAAVHPEDREKVERAIETALTNRTTYRVEHRLLKEGGGIAWIYEQGEATYHPETGEPLRMLGVAMDITERVRNEKVLKETQATMTQAQGVAQMGHWVLDVKSGHVTASTEFRRIFGLGEDGDLDVERIFGEFVLPEYRERHREMVRDAIETGSSFSDPHRIRRPNGEIRWVHVAGVAVRDPDTGETERLVGVLQDIHEQKMVELALRDSQATMTQAQTVGHMGHWVLDLTTNIAACSEETLRIMGLPQDTEGVDLEMIFGEMVLPEYVEEIQNKFEQAIATGGVFSAPHQLRRADGEVRWVHVYGQVAGDSGSGNPMRMVGVLQDIHEQKMVQIALQESEDSLARAQQMAHVGHWVWNPDTGAATCSAEVARILGKNPETYVFDFDTFLDAVHPDDRMAVERCAGATAQAGAPRDLEFRIVQPNGTERVVRSVGQQVVRYKGDAPRVICALHDITEQRENENAIRRLAAELERRVEDRTRELHAEKQRIENYLALAGNIFVALDATGHITLINRKGCELLGRTEQELLGADWFATALPRESRERVQSLFLAAMRGEQEFPRTFEVEIQDAGGALHVIAWENVLLHDEDGAIAGKLSSGIDITDRLAAEEAARGLHRQNQLILETAGDGIYGIDKYGVTTFVNPATARMTGWTRQEMHGKVQHELIHHSRADDQPYPAAECPIHQALRDGQARHVTDELFWRKDGTSFPVEYTVTPIHEGKKVTGAVVTFRDITERRRTEAELRSAQRMQALGNLAGGIAHSINNLLLPISMLTQVTRDEMEEGGEGWENLTRVIRASNRAAELTGRILAFSRSDEPRMALVNLPELVSNTLELVRRTTPSSIRLKSDIDPHAGTAMADGGQFESVLMNLISNAVDALADKPGAITVSVTPVAPDHNGLPHGAVEIVVSDTGPGIPEGIRERVFDPFFTTKPVGKGTGLGLAMAHGIVTRHDGTIVIDGDTGGAVIRIRLPRTEAVPARRGRTRKKGKQSHGTHTDH